MGASRYCDTDKPLYGARVASHVWHVTLYAPSFATSSTSQSPYAAPFRPVRFASVASKKWQPKVAETVNARAATDVDKGSVTNEPYGQHVLSGGQTETRRECVSV